MNESQYAFITEMFVLFKGKLKRKERSRKINIFII